MCTDFGSSHFVHACCSQGRKFFTKEEHIEHLKRYKAQLQNEIKGIEEHLQEKKK